MNNKIEHIGYLTNSIEETIKVFGQLGYHQDRTIVDDDTQRTKICFISKPGEIPIELVEPYEDNRTMQKMLSKRGNGPYHLCYCVEDIDASYEEMLAADWLPLFKPVVAPALGNRKICYFLKQEIGYIEFVNKL